MRAFPKAAVMLALGLYCVAAAGASNKALDTVNRAVEAMGGESALRQVRTMVITEKAQHWEPGSSVTAGGEPKFTGDSSIVVSRDFPARAVRLDWDRVKVGPGGSSYKFSEIYSDGVGVVRGANVGAANRLQREEGRSEPDQLPESA